MNETLGKVHFWLTFPSVYVIFLTMHFLGFTGMMRHIYDPLQYEFLKPFEGWNRLVSVAAFILFAAQMVFVANVAWSLRRGRRVTEADPWGANTLEWTTPTPPPHGNWPGPIPEVFRGPYEYGPGPEERQPPSEPAPAGEAVG